MPIVKKTNQRKSVGLMSLIDVVFLLLIFFLIVSVFVNAETKEYSVKVAAPENKEGEANILIQITDDGGFFFMDTNFFAGMEDFLDGEAYPHSFWNNKSNDWKLNAYKDFLKGIAVKGTKSYRNKVVPRSLRPYDKEGIRVAINVVMETIQDELERGGLISQYFVVVRCPSSRKYGDALVIIDAINQAGQGKEFFEYGLNGGSLADFTERGRMEFVPVRHQLPEMRITFGM